MALSSKQRSRVDLLREGVWGKPSKSASIQAFKRALRDVESPEELHQFVTTCNWDDGMEALELVLKHPQCDQGTALLMYWLGEPWCFAEPPKPKGVNRPVYDLLMLIEDLYLAGKFKNQTIKVDPQNIDGFNYLKIQADWQRDGYKRIPLGMTWPSPGKTLKRH